MDQTTNQQPEQSSTPVQPTSTEQNAAPNPSSLSPEIPASTPPTPPADASSSTPSPSSQTPPPASSNPPEYIKRHMSLRTILLIVVLAILAGVLLFLALSQNKSSHVATKMTPTPTVSPAHSILTMVLDTTSSPSGSLASKMVDVNLDTASNKVEGVQFEISYDPTVLTNVSVKPGTFFPNPLTLLNSVDTKNGKINFAVGIQPTAKAITGSGTVAVISYTLLPTAAPSVTKLSFLPKTQVIQVGTLGSVLEHSVDITIPVTGLSPAPASKSATSAAQ